MKHAPHSQKRLAHTLVVCAILGTLLAAGCRGNDDKPAENAFVTVTGHDLEGLSKRIASLEARMQQTQTLLLQTQKERNDLRTRLAAIEARLGTTTVGARANASQGAQPQAGTATPRH